MKRIGTWVLTAAVFFGIASASTAAGPPTSSATQSMPQVTIEAQRRSLEPRVHTFVYDITDRVDSIDSLAQWDRPICPLVAGLSLEQGEAMLTLLSQIVSDAGAKLAPRKCHPNFQVLVTSEPERLLKKLRARDRFMFGPLPPRNGEGPIEEFIHSARPIRVWYNTEFADYFHAEARTADFDTGYNFEGAPTVSVWANPKTSWVALLMLRSVIIVVDENRVKGYTLRQLADYIGMIGLTQINLDSAQRVSQSILRLFAASSPAEGQPAGLSSWDRAFLKSLYSTNQGSRWQRTEIVTQVVHQLIEPGATPTQTNP
jgi:hypothetical protein